MRSTSNQRQAVDPSLTATPSKGHVGTDVADIERDALADNPSWILVPPPYDFLGH
ncbi:MAG TPA: hypothetical protein PLK67_07890 [Bryobacteraceae bacterium]|nr:hypothetical protein [Bryobacteraceae bacterium]HOL71590.1 hypothetical protein [Bryobacteraceae bacterium]